MNASRFKPFIPALVWMALIFIGSSVPGKAVPQVWAFRFDKVIHTLEYVTLGFLVHAGLAGSKPPGAYRLVRTVLVAALIAALYGVTDEIHQIFTPGRTPDWRDALADTFGGTVGSLLGSRFFLWRLRKNERKNRSPKEGSPNQESNDNQAAHAARL